MRVRFYLLCLLVAGKLVALPAQPWSDTLRTEQYLDRSTRFAWTTFGGDLLQLSGGSAQWNDRSSTVQTTDFQGSTQPRLTIGGIHFWGHADFYVTFPLGFASIVRAPAQWSEFDFQHGIETGARVYPWSLRPGSLRPFAGISLRSIGFGFLPPEVEQVRWYPRYERFTVPLQAGITYTSGRYLYSLTAHYQPLQHIDFPVSEVDFGRVNFEPWSLQLGILRYLDLDAGARREGAASHYNKRHQQLAKAGKLSTFYVGIGPSSTLQTGTNSYLEARYPHLSTARLSSFNLDLTAGYFFHQPDLNVGMSYRGMRSGARAFNDELTTRRRSLMIETYKFLFNYLGFVPFLGVTASLEFLEADINDVSYRQRKPAFGIIFGWDIRVVKSEQSLLRTNLRYVPNLHLDVEGQPLDFDHLEFNFIQYIRFLGRGSQAK